MAKNDREQALGTTLDSIHKRFGDGAIMKLGDASHLNVEVIPTGSLSLDIALGVGGVDLYIRLEGREYPLRAALKLVQDVHQTPVVDGRGLKHTLERRVFELAASELGETPHFPGFGPASESH